LSKTEAARGPRALMCLMCGRSTMGRKEDPLVNGPPPIKQPPLPGESNEDDPVALRMRGREDGGSRILVQFMAGGNAGERIGYQTGGFEAVDSWKEKLRSGHKTTQPPTRSGNGGRRSRCRRSKGGGCDKWAGWLAGWWRGVCLRGRPGRMESQCLHRRITALNFGR
jgi:hypothetical protein